MSEHREPSELRQAEPWLRLKAERVFHTLVNDGDMFDDDEQERLIDQILFHLKVAYSEGYADRMKSEVAEVKSEDPPKRRRRKK